jgi:hypothetical protein
MGQNEEVYLTTWSLTTGQTNVPLLRNLKNEKLCNLYSSAEGDETKEGDMGRACSMNDRDEKCTQSISQET